MKKIIIKDYSNNPTVDVSLDTLKIKKQALVFVNTRNSAEKMAEDISKTLEKQSFSGPQKSKGFLREVKISLNELEELSNKAYKSLLKPTKQCERLAKCIKKGVAFHHAGLLAKQRSLIEENFRKGVIKIICATPTLCLSKETMIWHDISETEVCKFKNFNPLFVLSKNKLISMKAQKVQRIKNSSKLIQISSVCGYSIKVTPNHKMLIKRKNRKIVLKAEDIKKKDKIATIGKLNIKEIKYPRLYDFITDSRKEIKNYGIGPKLSYFIGSMLGDGYSGTETINKKIRYKASPSITGIDEEIFSNVIEICEKFHLNCRRTKNPHYETPQLFLSKKKWFREFMVRCGIEKGSNKHISKKLMSMNLENISFLLKGLFDTDGYIQREQGLGFTNISYKLIRQIQKLLLRFGIVSRIRRREGSSMKIYEKEYKTKPHFELCIFQKRSIIDFYKFIGFNVKRKQEALIDLVAKICSNLKYVSCSNCKYRLYRDIFSGRSKYQKEWGKIKLKVIKLLGNKKELGSRELKRILNHEPKKKDSRLNHHYELIKKRRIGSRSKTEWFWSLNKMGKWIYDNLINKNKKIEEFFGLRQCPLCGNELDWMLKKGWRDSDFEGDIFWDNVKEIKEVGIEEDVYDIVLPNKQQNEHMFVANGFIVHNSLGVSLPAYRSIIRDLKRYGYRGYDWIPVLEYLQQAGRAGRPEFDKQGQAIAIASTKGEKNKIIEKYINGEAEDIFSKLAVEPVLRTYLLSLISIGFVTNKKQIIDFFSKTFWAFQFADMHKLTLIIEKMLKLLETWQFIKSSQKDFVSADEIAKERIYATTIGKRIAELYIDPLTAHHLIECLKKASRKKTVEFSFLQAISNTLEMYPLLRTKTKEYEKIQEEFVRYNLYLLQNEPSMFEPEYENFINSIKTALFFLEWVNEKDDEYLMETFNIRPGETRVKLDIADWLLYSSEELCRLMQLQPLIKNIVKLRLRIKYGVKEELLPLLKLEQIGRVRARKLYKNKIRNIADVRNSDVLKLIQILGRKTALEVKKQVGDEIKEVPKRKRKGQISLKDY